MKMKLHTIKALLEVWGDLLGADMERVESEEGNLKAFRLSNQPEVGIVRPVKRSALFPTHTLLSSYVLTSESISDHAVVIFEGGASSSTRDCMAVTEFKTIKTNCAKLNPNPLGEYDEPNLHGEHAPIGQVMVYAAGDVLICLRCNGLDEKKYSSVGSGMPLD